MPINPTQSTNPIVGGSVTLQAQFKQHGVATDPDTVVFSYRRHSDTTATSYTFGVGTQIYRGTVNTATPPSTGTYYIDLNINTSERWYWGFYAQGRWQAAIEGYFDVEPSQVTLPSP